MTSDRSTRSRPQREFADATIDPLAHLATALDDLASKNRLRERPPAREDVAESTINLCSNDYLGYGARGALRPFAEAAARCSWAGAGASRLVAGEHRAHRLLERAIAEWLACDDALVFTSGYAANVGAITALVAPDDLVVSDALNHASIIDGCRLSRATIVVTPHCDHNAVRQSLSRETKGRRWVITESYFSMDGHIAPLKELRQASDEHGAALIVDEAHSLGVYGPDGRGLAADLGVRPDVLVGTLGKALAAQGAFVTGSRELCAWLWNRARSFVFSTGLSPLLAEIGTSAIGLARADEVARRVVHQRAAALRDICTAAGLRVQQDSSGPIVPVLLGDDGRAMRAAAQLRERGIWAQAIRPPTVPEGTARLRLTATAAISEADLHRFAEGVAAGLE